MSAGVGGVAETADSDPRTEAGRGGEPAALVIEAWERYLRYHTELRGPSPGDDALAIHTYSIDDARFELAMAASRAAFRGVVVGLATTTETTELTFHGESSATITTCITEEQAGYRDDSRLELPQPARRAAWARLTRLGHTGWVVAEVDFDRGAC